jgi:hypothetical protein
MPHHTPGGGAALSGRPFSKALRLNPSLKADIEEARKNPPGKSAANDQSAATAQRPAKQLANITSDGPEWGKQTPEEREVAVQKLKDRMAQIASKTSAKLVPYETEYFLFFSNLPQSEAQKWVAVLDRMYARLAELFAVPKGENIWYGKALITVLLSRDDYIKLEKDFYQNASADKHSGICHQGRDGRVEVVFYRAPSDLDFARLLVHETTHGFLHRYRSSRRIPSWANEGLAEVMEFELVPHEGLKQAGDARARSELHRPRPMEKFFAEDKGIENFQYPIARTLCEYMIRQNKEGYVDFINGIKDGLSWEESLNQKYGVGMDKLLGAYGLSMGVQDLKSE